MNSVRCCVKGLVKMAIVIALLCSTVPLENVQSGMNIPQCHTQSFSGKISTPEENPVLAGDSHVSQVYVCTPDEVSEA